MKNKQIISNNKELKLHIRFLLLFTIASGILFPFLSPVMPFDIFRAVVFFVLFCLFFLKKRHFDIISKIIIFFTFHVLVMALVTYIRQGHFSTVSLKILISSIFFIVGYNVIKEPKHLNYLLNVYFYGTLMLLGSIVLFNLLGIEPVRLYGGAQSADIYIGTQGANTTKAFPLLLFPLFLLIFGFRVPRKKRWVVYLFFAFAIVLILVGQKRGTILSFAVGLFVYFYFSPFKKKLFNNSILIILIMIASATFYWDMVETTFQARQARYSYILEGDQDALDTEARYWEIKAVTGDLKNRSALEIIFGMGSMSWQKYWGTKRMLHTDYMMFLNDTGVLGLFMYFFIYFVIFRRAEKFSNYLKDSVSFHKNIKALVYAIIAISLVLAISGFSHGIELRAYAFLFLGGTIGYMEHQCKKISKVK
jgi:hypothetical protein